MQKQNNKRKGNLFNFEYVSFPYEEKSILDLLGIFGKIDFKKRTNEKGKLLFSLDSGEILFLENYEHIKNNKIRLFDSTQRFLTWYTNEYLLFKDIVFIKHMPHVSMAFPEGYLETIDMDPILFERYNLTMSDVGVDHLFNAYKFPELRAKYSRLFCDLERYKDPSKEPMSLLGQGMIYENMYDGKKIIHLENEYKSQAENYYDEHHKKLNSLVNSYLKKGIDVFILDIHSYSDLLASSLGKESPFPDVCLGVDENYITDEVLNFFIKKVKERGLTYKINYPYSGTMVPSNYYKGKGTGKLYSLMLEINKRIYL